MRGLNSSRSDGSPKTDISTNSQKFAGDMTVANEMTHLTVAASDQSHRNPSGVEEAEWEPFDDPTSRFFIDLSTDFFTQEIKNTVITDNYSSVHARARNNVH